MSKKRTWKLDCLDCDYEEEMTVENKSEVKQKRVEHERKQDHFVMIQPLED